MTKEAAMETPASVHEFWFGTEADDAAVIKQQSALWWSKDPDTDERLRRRFEPSVNSAARHGLNAWADTPQGLLSLILLTDQFPRNIYRATPKAFVFDAVARAWCLDGLARKVDHALRPIERVFFYLPLEHAESLEHQEQSVRLYSDLLEDVPRAQKSLFEVYVEYAVRHRDIIARFDRFPHRNAIFGRLSTPQELEFLAQPGALF
jgi:uncharacterized protein (DUF924 family)